MLNKLTDILKEVFWLKPSKKKHPAPKAIKKTVKKTAKKKAVKKPVVKKVAVKAVKAVKLPKAPALDPNLVKTGEITHYFDRIKVCVVKITNGTVLIGDKVTVVGGKVKFVQKVWSMQIESADVKIAKKGQVIGIKIDKPVEPGYIVYK